MSLLDDLAESHIEAAVARGDLTDLPGAGRPLRPDDARHVPASLRAGYRLLKNAGYVPPEIEQRRELATLEDLLDHAAPKSAEAARLTRRARWLATCLGESRRGRALLTDADYNDRVQQRLMSSPHRQKDKP